MAQCLNAALGHREPTAIPSLQWETQLAPAKRRTKDQQKCSLTSISVALDTDVAEAAWPDGNTAPFCAVETPRWMGKGLLSHTVLEINE